MSLEIQKTPANPIMISAHQNITVGEGVGAHLYVESLQEALNLTLLPHAQVSLYCVGKAPQAQVQSLAIDVHHDASLTIFELSLLDDHTKRTTTVSLEKPGARVAYYGLDQLAHNADKQTELTIFHRSPNTHSSQAFRGIYAHHAHASFLGKVVVEEMAALSTAQQLYKSVLLSDNAKALVMPQLEIYNYDIKASHGATIGELDHEALFYLCSRGIALNEAKTMLLNSMINDIMDHLSEASIKTKFARLLEQSMDESLGAHHDA